jgi:hypothetical protein
MGAAVMCAVNDWSSSLADFNIALTAVGTLFAAESLATFWSSGGELFVMAKPLQW